jgi:tRNA-binding protein
MSGQQININDFTKIDLRIGLVKRAEKVPGSKKLVRLIVDLGTEERQIIAGLAEFYRPEDLINKYVVVVANLKPKRIMGLESHGMILAAGCDKEDKPIILTVEKPVRPGTRIC